MRAPVQDPRAAILSAERHASMHEEMAEKWTLQAKEATDPVLVERYESWARRSTEHAAKHRRAAALARQGEGL